MQKSILVLAFVFLVFTATAQAKSYSIEKAELYYKIGQDGLVIAEEHLEFNFIGSFSFAYRTIPLDSYTVRSFKVYDVTDNIEKELNVTKSFEGVRLSNDKIKYTWYYSATNERKKFVLKYELVGAVKAYNDVAEFYWKVWGSDWEVPVKEILGYVELPASADDANKIYFWGHPKINGTIELSENKKVNFHAFDVPSRQWVEIRVVFPREMLTSTENAFTINEEGLASILWQEKNWEKSEKTEGLEEDLEGFLKGLENALVIILFSTLFVTILIVGLIIFSSVFGSPETAEKLKKALLIFTILPILGLFLTFLLSDVKSFSSIAHRSQNLFVEGLLFGAAEIALFVLVWFFFGRDPKVDLQGIYEREPPYDYSPAVVEFLMKPLKDTPTPKSIAAEVLDLCLKGRLKLEKIKEKTLFGEKESYKIIIVNPSKEGLPKSEAQLLDLLCEAAPYGIKKLFIFSILANDSTPNEITLKELLAYIKENSFTSMLFFKNWQKAAREFADEQQFLSKKAYLIFSIGTAILCLIGFFIRNPVSITIVMGIAVIAHTFLPEALIRRTQKGVEHYIKWTRLKRFLSDFSSLKTVPPESIVLWEKYLVYAIPLGVADKVEKAMEKVLFADYKGGEGGSSIFVLGSAASFLAASFKLLNESLSSAFSQALSSRGRRGVGGFGGGGGFGGSGGGGGAG